MKLLKAIVIVMALGVYGLALAHGGGHADAISAKEAQDVARYVAVKLTEEDRGMGFGKLDASWKDIPDDGVAIKKSGPGYYVVAMKNENEKQVLYVLMSNTGSVYDANFSGEFKGID